MAKEDIKRKSNFTKSGVIGSKVNRNFRGPNWYYIRYVFANRHICCNNKN